MAGTAYRVVQGLGFGMMLGVIAAGAAVAADKAPTKTSTKAPAAKAAAKAAGPEVTLKGTMGCGKCAFHTADQCGNVLKVKDGGKETAYDLADNDMAKENHVCSGTKEVTVKGTVSDKGGKKLLTASEIKAL